MHYSPSRTPPAASSLSSADIRANLDLARDDRADGNLRLSAFRLLTTQAIHDPEVKNFVVKVATTPSHKTKEWEAVNSLAINALPRCGSTAASVALRTILEAGSERQITDAVSGIIRTNTTFGYAALNTKELLWKALSVAADAIPDIVAGKGSRQGRLVQEPPIVQLSTEELKRFLTLFKDHLEAWFDERPAIKRFQVFAIADHDKAEEHLKSWTPNKNLKADQLVRDKIHPDKDAVSEAGFVMALRTFGIIAPSLLGSAPVNQVLKDGMQLLLEKFSSQKLNETYASDLLTCAEWCERLARNAGPEFLHLVEREILAKRDQRTVDWDKAAKKGSVITGSTPPEPIVSTLLSMAKETGELGRVADEHLLRIVRECGKHLCSDACKGDYGITMLRQVAASNNHYAADARVELLRVSELGAKSWGLLLPPSQRQLKKLATAALETI
jgi:hypothetical protein